MTMLPATIAAVLILAAVLVLLKARTQRRLGGLPEGALVAGDNLEQDCPLLVSRRYGLKGKPDAVVRIASGDIVPIERKKTKAPKRGPYESDLIQATAYCLLIEEHYGRFPPFMRIQYSDSLV
jgi:CRISPR-associated exonuclease Cas4